MIRSFIFSQTQGRLISQDVSLDLLSVFLQDEGAQFWIDAGEVTDAEAKSLLDGVFHFHPLAIEDCLTPSDRPKIDEYEDYIFMVIHAVDFSPATCEFKTKELNMFIGKNFLVTFHREPMSSIAATIDRVMKNAPAVARAPDRLTYTILDFLMENYSPVFEGLSGDIVELENAIIAEPNTDLFAQIQRRRAQAQKLRQIVGPQREVLARLAHGEFKIVRQQMLPYYRDLLDQVVRISTLAENYRDSLAIAVQTYLSMQQVVMNRIIKILTIVATLSVPIIVVTSFYGMNVRHWPNMDHPMWLAYAWVFGTTGAITLALYLVLRWRRWW